VTLRFLADASYIDLVFTWGIATSTFYSGILWPTIAILDKYLVLGFPKDEPAAMDEISRGFNMHSNSAMDGCVMAFDGLLIRTRCLYLSETPFPQNYGNRKHGYGIMIMAGCDVLGKFLMSVANNTGGTHDIVSFESSDFYPTLQNGFLDDRYFIIGDEAFTCTQQVLTPWSGRGLGRWKDSFNYWLSHSRQAIEKAFGMLIQRWGIFWRSLRFDHAKWATVVIVAMKLHNFVLTRTISFNRNITKGM
jgi:hypothetical protein